MITPPDTHTPSLLLVEDDAAMAEALAAALTRRGYEVEVSRSAQHAMQRIGRQPPAFAIVDLRLPDGSGLAVVRALVEADHGTSVVVLTGYASIATAIEAIKLGAANYLCKPVNADLLDAALQGRHAEPPDAPAQAPLTVPLLEREHIASVLAENACNISATARALGMHRRTLQRKLSKQAGQH